MVNALDLRKTSGNIVGGSDPTWDYPAMLGLHNVPSAHSFPFLKQDRSTSRRYMRTVYCRNSEQVSRTIPTLWRQSWPPGCWHAAVLARAILAHFKLHLRTMKIGKRYSLGQSPKIAAHAVEWRRVLSVARLIGVLFREAACVKMCGEARIEAAHAHLHDVRR